MNGEITAERIEAERARMMLTKRALSDALDITSRTYWNYMKGGVIQSDVLIKMARLFECSTDYLLGLTNERTTA